MRGVDLHIDGEAAPVLDRVGSKPLHRRARVTNLALDGTVASDVDSAWESEDVEDAIGPRQPISRELAFPPADAQLGKPGLTWKFSQSRDCKVDQMAEIEPAGTFAERPAVEQGQGFGRLHGFTS